MSDPQLNSYGNDAETGAERIPGAIKRDRDSNREWQLSDFIDTINAEIGQIQNRLAIKTQVRRASFFLMNRLAPNAFFAQCLRRAAGH